MGQSVSKAAGRAAQRAAAASAKPSPPSAASTGAAPPPSLPTSNVSASAAAAEASAKVRPPSYNTPPSPQDLTQQQVLKESKGEDFTEMPEDLVNFLKDAGPLHKQEQQQPQGQRKKEPRLPRESWESNKSERIQESMPLAEKIEGFETTKSTSFSRASKEINPKIYQKGTTLDIYRLLSFKSNGENQTFDQVVAQTYAEYGKEHPLPDENDQDKHKQLLENTLKYLDLPVIMKDYKDNQDSYDGVHPNEVDIYETMKLDVLPKEKVRLVLEDLYELEHKKESS